MKLKALLPVILVLLYLPVNAQTQQKQKKEDIEAVLSSCLDKTENASTAGQCECIYEAHAKWDKRLNAVYKTLLSRLDSTAKNALIEAQREWIKFKEKEMALVNATWGNGEGTMWRPVRAEKVKRITQDRVEKLEELLEALPDLKGL